MFGAKRDPLKDDFLSDRDSFACVDSVFELFVCCKFKLSRFKTKEWKDYGESSLKCGSVAPPSYPSKHVDGATAIFIRGFTLLQSCIGAENDGDDWSVHVLAHEKISQPRSLTFSLPSLFTTRSSQFCYLDTKASAFLLRIHSVSAYFFLSFFLSFLFSFLL
jgi:hypothetical protein